MTFLQALAAGMALPDESEGRVYGWLLGTVTDLDTNLKRVRARVGKQGDNESSDWLVPIGMGSVESLPEIGEVVGVMFMDGDVHRGAYFSFPQSTSKARPMESAVLGSTFIAMYNDLTTKFNNLLSHYQAFYGFVQGHVHASFGTVSASLLPATIDATAKDTSTATGQGQDSQGATVPTKSGNQKVLSKRTLLR